MANDFCKEFAKTQKNAPVVLAVRLARRGTTVSLYNQFGYFNSMADKKCYSLRLFSFSILPNRSILIRLESASRSSNQGERIYFGYRLLFFQNSIALSAYEPERSVGNKYTDRYYIFVGCRVSGFYDLLFDKDTESSEALYIKLGPYYRLQLDLPGSSQANSQVPITAEGIWQLTPEGMQIYFFVRTMPTS